MSVVQWNIHGIQKHYADIKSYSHESSYNLPYLRETQHVSDMGSIPQLSILKGALHSNAGPSRRLHQLFSEAAAREKKLTALMFEDENGTLRETSYQEADDESWRLARGILSHCAGRVEANTDGDRVVVVCLPPSPDLVLVLLAVWKTGSAYLPLEPGAPPQRVSHILGESKPYLIISSQKDKQLFSGKNTISIDALKDISRGLSCAPLEEESNLDDHIEIILYTSGSTGLSKGVRIRNSSAVNRLQWQWREFPFSSEERVCVFKTALTFVDSVPELWAPLLCPAGGRSVLVVPKSVTSNPQLLVPLLHNYKIGRLVLVPTLLKSILTYLEFSNSETDVLNSLKLWVCSGETLSVPLAVEFFKKFGDNTKSLCNFYGSTEIMGDVTFHVMKTIRDVNFEGKVPIGIPVDNTILYLLDKELQIVAAEDIGELYVAGKHIAAGYVNGRDAFRFIENPHTVDPEFKYLFKTGDYGRIFKSTLLFEGRTDSQIKIRGHRVDLSEVEVALNKIPIVEKGVVLCFRSGETDQEILGFILLKDGYHADTIEIEKSLENCLPVYAMPQIVFVESIPLLVNGKVDRQYLLKHYREQSKEEFNIVKINGIESGKEEAAEVLFKTVYSVLGRAARAKISPSANFYQIGGNSLNSVLTIAKLKEAGYVLKISDFISARNLAEVIDKMTKGHTENGYHSEKTKYTVDLIDDKYKADVYRIIGDSFFQKADIELTMDPPVKRNDYDALLDLLWPALIKQKHSIVVKNAAHEVIGTSLFFNAADEPDVTVTSQLRYVFQFLEYLEVPVIERLLTRGKILHSFMLGTHQNLTPQENIEVTEFMEREVEEIAKENGYIGIFTTNTSPLTQQLAENVLNYKALKTYQVNEFVAPDGTRPFKRGPDSLVAVCSFKELQ